MAATISQLSCSSYISRNFHLQQRRSSSLFFNHRSKLSVVRSVEGQDAETSSSGNMPKLSYAADLSSPTVEPVEKSYPETEEHVNGKIGGNGTLIPDVVEQKKAAKIHDFCFGIPFGGFVLTGGLLGSIFSRNLASLGTGVLFGGAILAFSIISLKVWKEGKSSFPLIIGQAVLAATLLWKNFQNYSVSKKLFPSGLYVLVSAAMLLFYSYVVISGGNPPPKKLKSVAEAAS
ncbi:protein FATTY ACID EXPORT 1, chloroplastic-like [Chenopodium quinoa]|uniref:protein FATTY ACID EXPORT 1, chloroplastic-like n=1 Tax=Chenopodium quinoa TaxID=63459 RepID=UPI000B78682D|nr:protein FATTY ACID EXPORT 1, chloroplastic-like [Chenopodium quinoa]